MSCLLFLISYFLAQLVFYKKNSFTKPFIFQALFSGIETLYEIYLRNNL